MQSLRGYCLGSFVIFSTALLVSGAQDAELRSAVEAGDSDKVRSLLEGGTDPHLKMEDGRSLLHFASRAGHLEVCKHLVSKGHRVDAADEMGRTPLMDASWHAQPEVVSFLLQNGADVDVENQGGGTALKVAMRRKHPQGSDAQRKGDEVVRILRQHIAGLGAASSEGKQKYQWHRDPDWKWDQAGTAETGQLN
mmetsp:Transcript_11406/g.17956  ORF Transcript_11406/g.17956 Transcript_11406/m.17956 type:complete len:194 (-) Transcript_11406:897-1478(-)|eukprot:CAMPEP_0184293852 /NCGR_PEP_ID=MMETSP1049-20130417/5176_1 /TAXON_ID=77928 /ORGANISM="Proteomonas sulcata, Strain CCMP704" /LENGTH=193 /DNA_ID=CAMNT_0026601937 /DNA_START=315 /DNA_END=896 /DNA_ORIENTATION=-